ncbi:hypothetical protein KF707_20610 [Candidatus Obscuribacterales bacterium]|nr:hypothetical protein [Candidatus Obscuribacterales bacterium]MBX3138643.1 hypothetical protein [Candidatus Obscuribacterales bacterium]
MWSRKTYLSGVCSVALLSVGGGLAFGLSASPDFFMPRLEWQELKAILEKDDVAKRRVKRVTCNSSNYPSKDYPSLVLELVEPERVVKVGADQLPFALSPGTSCSLMRVDLPVNPRIEWVLRRCDSAGVDFRENIHFEVSFHRSKWTEDVIKDGKALGPHPEHVPLCLINDPGYVTTWLEAKP